MVVVLSSQTLLKRRLPFLSNITMVSSPATMESNRSNSKTTNSTTDINTTTASASTTSTFDYIEFYAGIGGWSYALELWYQRQQTSKQQPPRPHCIAAYDHSDLCVRVCHHNGILCCQQQRIEQLVSEPQSSAKQQEVLPPAADLWCLSPPCQPHTRQHDRQAFELQDARSQSFVHLCQHLVSSYAPKCMLLENVVGFESSQSCCTLWRHQACGSRYRLAHFHLTPTQIVVADKDEKAASATATIPNDRPRYYCIAIRNDCFAGDDNYWKTRYFTDVPLAPSSGDDDDDDTGILSNELQTNSVVTSSLPFTIHTAIPELGVIPLQDTTTSVRPRTIASYLDDNNNNEEDNSHLILSRATLQRSSSWCLDIVRPESRRSSCFTAGYGKFMRGTGSVLLVDRHHDTSIPDDECCCGTAQQHPQERTFDPNWAAKWLDDDDPRYYLRYLSGTELARLHGFPTATFSFPPDCTTKQQWKLVGNSLQVEVATKLVELAMLAMYDPSLQNE